jgi:hypothetical protein
MTGYEQNREPPQRRPDILIAVSAVAIIVAIVVIWLWG